MFLLGSAFTDILDAIWRFFCSVLWWIAKAMGWLLDFCQTLVRKLVGLDTYYFDGVPIDGTNGNAVSGDIIEMIVRSDVVRNLFISLLVLGVILLFIVTFVCVWKSEWNFEKEGNSKTKIINASFRALVNFIAVPVITFFGIFVGNALLRAIDGATKLDSQRGISNMVFASLCANAVRSDHKDDDFNNQLIIANSKVSEEGGKQGLYLYFTSSGTNEVDSFDIVQAFREGFVLTSKGVYEVVIPENINADFIKASQINQDLENGTLKFDFNNENLVDLFFDHTEMNYLLAYIALIFMIKAMLQITYGLAKRLFNLAILFIVSPPIVAMTPLNSKALEGWRSLFISNATSAYVTIAIYNIYLSIYPVFEKITLFKGGTGVIGWAENQIVAALLVAVGLLTINELAGAISKILGTGDVYADSVKDGKSFWGKAAGIAGTALKPFSVVGKAAGKAVEYGKTAHYEGIGSSLKKMGGDIKGVTTKGVLGEFRAGTGIDKVIEQHQKHRKLTNEYKPYKDTVKAARKNAYKTMKENAKALDPHSIRGHHKVKLAKALYDSPHKEVREKYWGIEDRLKELALIENKNDLQIEEEKNLLAEKAKLAENYNLESFNHSREYLEAYERYKTIAGGAKRQKSVRAIIKTSKEKENDPKTKVKDKTKNRAKKVEDAVTKQTAITDAENQIKKEIKEAKKNNKKK